MDFKHNILDPKRQKILRKIGRLLNEAKQLEENAKIVAQKAVDKRNEAMRLGRFLDNEP